MTPGLASSPLLIAAIALGVLGALMVLAGIFALFGLHPVRFVVRTLVGLLFLSLAATIGAIAVGVQGYQALTREEIAARLFVRPTDPQRFAATVRFANGREETFDVAGDEIYVDAHILKWKSLANLLGLHTAYELSRLAGRYRDIGQERSPTKFFLRSLEGGVFFFTRLDKAALPSPPPPEYGLGGFFLVSGPRGGGVGRPPRRFFFCGGGGGPPRGRWRRLFSPPPDHPLGGGNHPGGGGGGGGGGPATRG